MKKGYMIGLFFIVFVIVGLIVIILLKRNVMQEWQNQNKKEIQQEEQSTENEVGVSQVNQNDVKTTCDTEVLYLDIDRKDGTMSYCSERIPGKYIDMTREELEWALYEDSKVLSLEDKEKGFESQHLELFSKEKIKIVRIYDTSKEKSGFYIMAVDHAIWIYKADKKTLYFKTDLVLEDLPDKVQKEVMAGKYMNSEVDIYHFLESYSS